jgi:hypothetical protein
MMKTVVISVVIFIGLLFASCNTYERCPAYGAAEVEVIENNV